MSTNRSYDPSSLCSFTFARRSGGPVFRRRSGGLQTGQRDGRERTWCPVAPAFRGGLPLAVVVAGLQTRKRDGREQPVSSRRQATDLLSAVVVQTLHLAQHERISAYGTDSWSEIIRTSRDSRNKTEGGGSSG